MTLPRSAQNDSAHERPDEIHILDVVDVAPPHFGIEVARAQPQALQHRQNKSDDVLESEFGKFFAEADEIRRSGGG